MLFEVNSSNIFSANNTMHYLSYLLLILSDSLYEGGITGTSEIKCKYVNHPLKALTATLTSSAFLAS